MSRSFEGGAGANNDNSPQVAVFFKEKTEKGAQHIVSARASWIPPFNFFRSITQVLPFYDDRTLSKEKATL
jgi:hypothetical protein